MLKISKIEKKNAKKNKNDCIILVKECVYFNIRDKEIVIQIPLIREVCILLYSISCNYIF